ncbi:ABC transporter permease [Pseudoflavonifractor sp. 60]|uniref:ABC transporter permease n=1 Tax=Pseudoflavonifractor sp. 60 TaxID=2304576 RepID=UPI0013695474|nr:FtsX-like permease family protein [Pseudoflavonifractor sp. 60]NBI66098.1 ABC transporter permease [Pseudoflavonifractor sp. 60]
MTWPFENDTSAVIRKLSNARLRHNHFRNRLIGVIIFMAAAIMAFVSSYAYNVTSEYAASTAYQGIFQNLSQENISLLTADPRIESVGVYRSVGMTERENGVTMGIVCSDEATMRLSNITLMEGCMPQAANELLIEKGYIDALKLKADIGDTISVYYRNQASRQLETADFQITGFIQTAAESDRNRVAYNAIVSQNFVRKNSALSAGPVAAMISVRDTAKYTNQELKELIRTIGLDCGISTDNIQINNLYIDSNNMSKETVLTVLLVGLVLLGVCFLVIYNIFFISVMNNVTSFGQLRTLGATKKQIKRIISKEGNCLALRFIPLGCIAGGMLSFLIDRTAFQLFPDAVIVLLSGTAVFICVKLSILKPAKIAMSVSPMEASRYSSYIKVKKSGKRLKRNRKPLTPCSLAAMNLLRDRKKGILTFTSLVLSGMMLVGISSLLSSLDPEQRAKQSFPYEGAYVVELNRALVTPTFSLTRLQENNLLTDELKHDILSIDGVSGVVCQQELCVTIDGMETAIRSMNAEDYEALKDRVMAGELPYHDHTGENSLVVNMGSPELEYLQKSYGVGDTVTFSQAGNDLQGNFTYVVSAIVFDKNSASSFILPAEEMEQTVPYNANSAFVIRMEHSGYSEIEDELHSLIASSDHLRLKTLKDMTMQYKSVFSTISLAAYALLAVIIMFSIINLVNTSMTNIISRRKEMGLFRAIGLDSRQLYRMIGFENGFQTLGSFAASIVGGLIIGKAICSAVGNVPGFSFVEYTFPAVSVVFYFLLVFALQFVLTKWAGLYCRRNSVVEQLRVTE